MLLKIVSGILLAVTSSALAQGIKNEEVKIGIVNIQKVEQSSNKVGSFRKNFEIKQKKYQQDIKKTEEKITKQTEALKNKTSILSSDQIKNEERKIQIEIDKYSKEVNTINMTLEMVKNYGINTLNECMMQVVEDAGKNMKIGLILPTTSTIYVDPEKIEDLTSITIKKLDQSNCKIDIESYFKKAEAELRKVKK